MRLLGGAARVVGAVCVAVLVLGVPVQVLTAPAVTHTLVSRFLSAPEAGITADTALRAAEDVRVYVTDPAAPPLPPTVEGRPGFDAAASSHLLDVRGVLLGARTLTLLAAAAGALLLAVALARGRRRAVAWSLSAGALGVLAVALAAALFAAVDFDTFFRAFHVLFFRAGTWTFPADSLLIRLFPEPFWAALGVLWALGVLVLGTACLLAARALSRSADSHEKVYV